MQNFQTKLKELWEKIKSFFKKLNKKMRILLGVCLVVILAVALFAFVQMNKREYATLITGLSSSDITTVVNFLNNNGMTDYQIQGDSVLVPKGRETQLQGQLALSGNLSSGFLYPYYTENVGLTSTSAEQERAWLISVQERLEAIIKQFNGVRDAQVTIDMGTDRVYLLQDNVTPTTASVFITPESRDGVSDDVAKAIRNVVSHSVEKLNIENVSIDDAYGNPYSDTDSISKSSEATALKLQHEEQINRNIRSQVLQVLGAVYGEDNVTVAVTSNVEVSRKIVDKTYYDQPDGSVKGGGLVTNDTLFWEIIRDGSEPTGGTVGTSTNSNLPIYPDLDTELDGNAQYVGEQIDRDQVVNITKEQMEVLEGRLTDLRVTVFVNGSCDNAGAMTVDQLKESVATISGIGAESVEAAESRVFVTIAPFAENNVPDVPGGFFQRNSWVLYAAIAGLVLFVVLLLIIILLARSSKKKKLAKQKALEEEMMAAEAAAEAAAILAAAPPTGGADIMEVNTEKSMELRKSVRQFAQNNPEIAAQMVKAWLKGDESGG